MDLQIITKREIRPFRCLLHGSEGAGKTTFATCAPKPIFIQTEDGAFNFDVPRFPLCAKLSNVFTCLQHLISMESCEYKTVVIDSLDWFEKLIVADILEKNARYKTIAEFPYGQGYDLLKPPAVQLLDSLNLLYKRGMHVVLIAHTKIEKIADPTGEGFDQYAPRLDKRINGMFKEWADMCLYATYYAAKKEVADGMNKTRTVAVQSKYMGNDRVLYTDGTPAIVAKNRYNLPPVMPLDGKQFFLELYRAIHGEP